MNTELTTAERLQRLLDAELTLTWRKHLSLYYVANNGAIIDCPGSDSQRKWKLNGQSFATLKEAKAEANRIYREENR